MTPKQFEKWRLEPRQWMRNLMRKRAMAQAEGNKRVIGMATLAKQLGMEPKYMLAHMKELRIKHQPYYGLRAREVARIVEYVAARRGRKVLRQLELEEEARQKQAKRAHRTQLRQQAAQQKMEPPLPLPYDVQRKKTLNWWDYRRRLARGHAPAKKVG